MATSDVLVLLFSHAVALTPTVLPAASRIVAIGDLHGDRRAFVRTLRNAQLIDEDERWRGGSATLVQLGDVFDRGPQEAGCWSLLRKLQDEAPAAGGRVVRLIGNHEVMNVCGIAGNFIHPASLDAFGPDRLAAFAPGGALATELADSSVVYAIVGESCFVHAHLPADATLESLDELNQAAGRWLRGEPSLDDDLLCTLPDVDGWEYSGRPQEESAMCLPFALSHMAERDESPIWGRALSSPSNGQPAPSQCDALRATLGRLGVRRLVVGHTPQNYINAACDELVWRCDTGMSAYVAQGKAEALEISPNGEVRVLGEDTKVAGAGSAPLSSNLSSDFLDVNFMDIF